MRNPRGNNASKAGQRRAGDNELGKRILNAATHAARKAGAGDDVASQAALAAYEHGRSNPRATADELVQVAERRARNLASEQRKKQSRVLTEARTDVDVASRSTGIAWGRRQPRARAQHKRLPSNVQRALAGELELHERDLYWSIGSGLLLRGSRLRDGSLDRIEPPEERERRRAECASADWYERYSYERIFADIARHAGLELETDSLVDELIAFRERDLVARCEICGPDSRWTYCKHTLPNFERGKQVSGVSLQGRGRRSLRMNHHAKFGTNIDDMPYSNYNSRYLEEAAAGRLVTEALRLAGVDPTLRHVLERERKRDSMREIRRFLKSWERGPDGELHEKPSRRRRSRSTPGEVVQAEEARERNRNWETVQKQARESMSPSTEDGLNVFDPKLLDDEDWYEATGKLAAPAPGRQRRLGAEVTLRGIATSPLPLGIAVGGGGLAVDAAMRARAEEPTPEPTVAYSAVQRSRSQPRRAAPPGTGVDAAVTRDEMGHESPATGASAPLRKRRPTSESLARAQATGNWDTLARRREERELGRGQNGASQLSDDQRVPKGCPHCVGARSRTAAATERVDAGADSGRQGCAGPPARAAVTRRIVE